MVALLLALTNRIIPHHVLMAEGHWRIWENGLASIPLKGRKIGLLGYGYVNRNTHKLLSGFDAGFAILKRSWEGFTEPLPTPAARFEAHELHSFLKFTDVLLIALPLTSQTEGIIRMPELELLGSDGLLVNVSRGRLIDEHDLYTALERRVIAGAALDVWYDYRPEPDVEGRRYPYDPAHPFHALGNVVLSPHRGASPIHDLSRWDEVIENVQRFSQGKEPINVVDIEHGY